MGRVPPASEATRRWAPAGNGTRRWHVEESYNGLMLVSPSGTGVTCYWYHQRARAEEDVRRLNGEAAECRHRGRKRAPERRRSS